MTAPERPPAPTSVARHANGMNRLHPRTFVAFMAFMAFMAFVAFVACMALMAFALAVARGGRSRCLALR